MRSYAYGCLFGVLSAQSGCTAALVYDIFFAVCNMIFAVDYLLKDGHLFYTQLFVGHGAVMFVGVFVCTSPNSITPMRTGVQ
jgi:hypothetical protein